MGSLYVRTSRLASLNSAPYFNVPVKTTVVGSKARPETPKGKSVLTMALKEGSQEASKTARALVSNRREKIRHSYVAYLGSFLDRSPLSVRGDPHPFSHHPTSIVREYRQANENQVILLVTFRMRFPHGIILVTLSSTGQLLDDPYVVLVRHMPYALAGCVAHILQSPLSRLLRLVQTSLIRVKALILYASYLSDSYPDRSFVHCFFILPMPCPTKPAAGIRFPLWYSRIQSRYINPPRKNLETLLHQLLRRSIQQ